MSSTNLGVLGEPVLLKQRPEDSVLEENEVSSPARGGSRYHVLQIIIAGADLQIAADRQLPGIVSSWYREGEWLPRKRNGGDGRSRPVRVLRSGTYYASLWPCAEGSTGASRRVLSQTRDQ